MIIIIAIAVLVLIVLAAFFVGGVGRQVGTITDTEAFSKGCLILKIGRNCAVSPTQIVIKDYKPLGQDTDGSLLQACQNTNNGADDATCKRSCGC